MHFNPFHDPKNGQFSSGGGSGSARQYRKALNKITKDEIKNMYIKYKNDEALDKMAKKFGKDMHKKYGDNLPSKIKVSPKYYEKIQKRMDASIEASKAIAEGRRLANRIIKDAAKHGYTVNSKTVLRNANAGKHMAVRALAAAADLATGYRSGFGRAARIGSLASMDIVDARKYTVRKTKE